MHAVEALVCFSVTRTPLMHAVLVKRMVYSVKNQMKFKQ